MGKRIVVVGASLAGVRAARSLRRAGYLDELMLVGAETHFPPYDRPPLSKEVLSGNWTPQRGRLDASGLEDAVLRLGERAEALDAAGGTVTVGGTPVAFDGLVVATGAAVRTLPLPPEIASRALVLRTLEDSLALAGRLRPGQRVAVVGAGFLGCEIAAAAVHAAVRVHLIDRLGLPMVAALGETVAAYVAGLHRRHGVDLHLGVSITGITPGPGAHGVRIGLDDGAVVEADTLVVAVGATPETAWLAGSGLLIEDGVVCDRNCVALGADRVVAAGDVARWEHPLLRTRVRVEHWTNAAMQADVAARNLLAVLTGGEPTAYDALPYFWSHQYGVKIQFVGTASGTFVVQDGAPGEDRFVGLFRDPSGSVVGGVCVNRPDRLAGLTAAIKESLA
jgi:NADPH-dependent 2,4-dienoyl-CoA reductase/sulfur reductase-like enzyme